MVIGGVKHGDQASKRAWEARDVTGRRGKGRKDTEEEMTERKTTRQEEEPTTSIESDKTKQQATRARRKMNPNDNQDEVREGEVGG